MQNANPFMSASDATAADMQSVLNEIRQAFKEYQTDVSQLIGKLNDLADYRNTQAARQNIQSN